MKVLIVDDQYINRYLLEKLLSGNGYEVVSAENGYEALEKVENNEIDLIISDILLPKMDGFQFCRKIKSNPQFAKIPFIFYTAAYTEKKDQDFAESLGADNFIIKPADPVDFIGIIRDLLNNLPKHSTSDEIPVYLEDGDYFSEHNKRLFHQLDKKLLELEHLNKNLRISEQRYKNLFENANDAIILHAITGDNQPGQILEVNEVACKVIGYSREDLLGKSITDLDTPKIKNIYSDIIKTLFESGHLMYESQLMRSDGMIIPMEVNSHLYQENENQMCLSIYRDISARKKAMAELSKAVTRINNNIYQMAIIGDKIRNPLAIILSACEECNGEKGNIVVDAVYAIDDFIKELDNGWVESDKIRQYLKLNYGIGDDRNTDISEK